MTERLLFGKKESALGLQIYAQLLGRLHQFPLRVLLGFIAAIAALGSLLAVRTGDVFVGALTLAAVGGAFTLLWVVSSAPDFHRISYEQAFAAERRYWFAALGTSAAIGALSARALIVTENPLIHLLVVALAMATMAMALRNYFRPRLVAAQLFLINLLGIAALLTKDASEYWLLAIGSAIYSLIIYRTASALSSSEQASILNDEELREQNRRFNSALSNMKQGLSMFDDEGRMLVCNQNYIDMYGFSPEVVRPGITLQELLQHSIDVGNYRNIPINDLHDRLVEKLVIEASPNFLSVLGDGRTIALSHQKMETGGWVTTHEDITERMQTQAQIAYLARHDVLTDLPNRVSFRERLGEALERTTSAEQLAVLCLDLDRFKPVNDTLGHAVGDAVLRQVAERLKDCVRETDFVARMGGDEFAIIQIGVANPESTGKLADRVVAALGQPFHVDSHQISIGTSIGMSFAPEDSVEADQLLKNADMALYQAKAEGRGQSRRFLPDMDRRMQTRMNLELDLRHALSAGEFEIYYQPLMDIASGGIAGFEALLRWHHPSRGMVLPDEFIELAEDTGLIVPIGDWVLKQACSAASAWPANIRIAVNLSPAQFRSGDLVRSVTTALAASGIGSNRLELEITEGVLLADSEETLATLHALKNLGARIAMDDFGTGYSSLSYLRSFPFDKIKIDQSFVHDIFSGDQSLSIIRAVTGLGRNLGMSTTAEGVETAAQLEQLRSEGCSEVQGFHLGRPMDAAATLELLGDKRGFPTLTAGDERLILKPGAKEVRCNVTGPSVFPADGAVVL